MGRAIRDALICVGLVTVAGSAIESGLALYQWAKRKAAAIDRLQTRVCELEIAALERDAARKGGES